MPFKKPSDVFPFTASALRRNDNMVAMIADPSPETPAKNEEGVAKMSKAALRKAMMDETMRKHFAREQVQTSKMFNRAYVEEFGEPLLIVDPVEEGDVVVERGKKDDEATKQTQLIIAVTVD